MLSTHLICGALLGLGAALSGWVAGLPPWSAVIVCALAAISGVLASALGMHLFPPVQPSSPETVRQTASQFEDRLLRS